VVEARLPSRQQQADLQRPPQTLAPGRGIEYRWYDQRGNTTAISSTDLVTTGYQVNTHLSYDAQQRPITITLEDHDSSLPTTTVTMATVVFGYNALGQRSAYTSTTAGYPALSYAAHLQYRDGQLAQAVVISGTATGSTTYTDTYVYDQGGNPLELIRARSSGVTDRYWYELDGRGNVVALTDGSGAVVDRYSYDLWGEVKLAVEDPSVRQQLRYAGYWYNTKLEWYWLSVRSYVPEGWFIQPDPSMIEGTRSYVYSRDDPVDMQDPSGLDPCPAGTPLSITTCVSPTGASATGTIQTTMQLRPTQPNSVIGPLAATLGAMCGQQCCQRCRRVTLKSRLSRLQAVPTARRSRNSWPRRYSIPSWTC